MAMLSYQQEAALSKLNQKLVKDHTEYDYFELLDIFRQLENEGYVNLDKKTQFSDKFIVYKTAKGASYHYNWLHSEFK